MRKITKPLYKTTIVIWTDFDPTAWEIVDLAKEATDGSRAYCSEEKTVCVKDPANDITYPDTDFFGER